MATGFDWSKLWAENIIKPLVSNSRLINILIMFALGTGTYTAFGVAKKVSISEPEKPALVQVPRAGCNCGDAIKHLQQQYDKEHR